MKKRQDLNYPMNMLTEVYSASLDSDKVYYVSDDTNDLLAKICDEYVLKFIKPIRQEILKLRYKDKLTYAAIGKKLDNASPWYISNQISSARENMIHHPYFGFMREIILRMKCYNDSNLLEDYKDSIETAFNSMMNEIYEYTDNITEKVGPVLRSTKYDNALLGIIIKYERELNISIKFDNYQTYYPKWIDRKKQIFDILYNIDNYQTCDDLSWDSRKQQILDILNDK